MTYNICEKAADLHLWLIGPGTQSKVSEMLPLENNFKRWLAIDPTRARRMFTDCAASQVGLTATPFQ
jgi:hypothetical protein